jgi:hypothetical protein
MGLDQKTGCHVSMAVEQYQWTFENQVKAHGICERCVDPENQSDQHFTNWGGCDQKERQSNDNPCQPYKLPCPRESLRTARVDVGQLGDELEAGIEKSIDAIGERNRC